jgi:hypothetical protein
MHRPTPLEVLARHMNVPLGRLGVGRADWVRIHGEPDVFLAGASPR